MDVDTRYEGKGGIFESLDGTIEAGEPAKCMLILSVVHIHQHRSR